MATTTGTDRTEPGPSGWDSQPSIHSNITYTEDITLLEEHWDQMANKIIRRIDETPGANSRFHRGDVIKFDSHHNHKRILEILHTGAYEHRGIYFIIATHHDHFHVLHDCNNGGGSCR